MYDGPVKNLHNNTGLVMLFIPMDCTVATL